MKLDKRYYQLYLVTNDNTYKEDAFYQALETSLKAGVTLVQLREKELTGRAFYERAVRVREITKQYKVPLIINDRLDIAQAVGADGVHLGQSDIPVNVARRILGKNMIIGASTKTLKQAIAAVEEGADYLGVGAIFPTKTKVITQKTDVSVLREITNQVPIPVVAIGGINKNNIMELKNTNISGVSVVSAIMGEDLEKIPEIVIDLLMKSISITKDIKN
jgi:thiamine-phosphate pyrophosphorylase